jgi:hypothetical protein
MNERMIFRVAVRIIGLMGILRVINHWARLYHVTGGVHFNDPWKLIFEICLILIGVYMVMGGPLIVRLITPKDSEGDAAQDKDTNTRP